MIISLRTPRPRGAVGARDAEEHHRVSTPLELFFDLCFVVAVGQAGRELAHAIGQGQLGHGVAAYATVFFAIWWAWMNYSWFATAFDSGRHPVPAGHLRADRRVAGDRRRGAARLRAPGLHGRRHRVRHRPAGLRLAVDPRLPGQSRAARARGALGRRRAPRAAAVGAAAVGARVDRVRRRIRRAGRRRVAGSVLGRARRDAAVPSAAHRRAVRPVHADRARRDRLGRDGRDPGRR